MIFYVLHIESFCDTHIIDLCNILEDFNHRQQKMVKNLLCILTWKLNQMLMSKLMFLLSGTMLHSCYPVSNSAAGIPGSITPW